MVPRHRDVVRYITQMANPVLVPHGNVRPQVLLNQLLASSPSPLLTRLDRGGEAGMNERSAKRKLADTAQEVLDK